jgi:hypothetical protein
VYVDGASQVTHVAENVGDIEAHAIAVELKKPSLWLIDRSSDEKLPRGHGSTRRIS